MHLGPGQQFGVADTARGLGQDGTRGVHLTEHQVGPRPQLRHPQAGLLVGSLRGERDGFTFWNHVRSGSALIAAALPTLALVNA
jgi:hypothetical protein